jgi:hypothetical protein
MMEVQPRFPNVERVAMELLSDLAPAYTQLPDKLDNTTLPLFRIKSIGGPMDLHQYYARIDVEAFASDYDTANQLAGDAAQTILAVCRKTAGGALIDYGTVPNGLQSPFYSQDTFRVQFEASLILRRSVQN